MTATLLEGGTNNQRANHVLRRVTFITTYICRNQTVQIGAFSLPRRLLFIFIFFLGKHTDVPVTGRQSFTPGTPFPRLSYPFESLRMWGSLRAGTAVTLVLALAESVKSVRDRTDTGLQCLRRARVLGSVGWRCDGRGRSCGQNDDFRNVRKSSDHEPKKISCLSAVRL